jgi:nucleotide-binding universal stress UspA family protein
MHTTPQSASASRGHPRNVTVIASRQRPVPGDPPAGFCRGAVLCLFERSPRWAGTLRAATLLAVATGMQLVIDPGAPRHGARRRIAHLRDTAQAVGARTLVTSAAGTSMAALVAPDRSPALAATTGIDTMLVPEQAAAGRADGNALVCGVDDSPAAYAAVRVAGALSASLERRLHLLHVYNPIAFPMAVPATMGILPLPPHELERPAREAAERVLERAEHLAGCEALTRLRRGRPATSLNAYAELFNAPLIVLGAPRQGPLAAALLGSPAWELANSSSRPILFVGEEATTASSQGDTTPSRTWAARR